MTPKRIPGDGWLALLGGGEFSFGHTEDADRAWLAKTGEETAVGFLPTASGSTEYGGHFAAYLREHFNRETETIPIYRARDARRGKNRERIAESGALYVGGGVVDHLLDALAGSPAAEAMAEKLRGGGVIVAIAAAAQAFGEAARSPVSRRLVDGLAWLPGGGVEPNFDPRDARHLRALLELSAVRWGLGIASGSAVLLGPDGAVEVVGEAYVLDDADGDIEPLGK